MTKPAAEVIDPRDLGYRTLDLKQPLFDEETLVRADQALQELSADMRQWLRADIDRLHAARLAAERDGWSAAALESLFSIAHDIKGTGATYGSLLATKLAASLCRSIETDTGKAAARRNPALVRAHVDALRAVGRDRVHFNAHPIGFAVLHELEALVEALGVAPR
jgi:hypothetical protein